MDRKQKIKDEVEKTLAQFEHVERLQGNPFLLTKIEARIQSKERAASWHFSRGLLRPALVLLIIAANIVTVFSFLNHHSGTAGQADYISAFAREFGLDKTIDDPFSTIK